MLKILALRHITKWMHYSAYLISFFSMLFIFACSYQFSSPHLSTFVVELLSIIKMLLLTLTLNISLRHLQWRQQCLKLSENGNNLRICKYFSMARIFEKPLQIRINYWSIFWVLYTHRVKIFRFNCAQHWKQPMVF